MIDGATKRVTIPTAMQDSFWVLLVCRYASSRGFLAVSPTHHHSPGNKRVPKFGIYHSRPLRPFVCNQRPGNIPLRLPEDTAPRRHSRMNLKARQFAPAIDAAIYRPNGTLYQLQSSFHLQSTQPEPTARARWWRCQYRELKKLFFRPPGSVPSISLDH